MKVVDLSERVTATYYDDEHEEWSQKTAAISDVLDSVCDDYTVIEVEPVKHGKWIKIKFVNEHWIVGCSNCMLPNIRESRFCPACGAKMDEVGNG